MTLIELGQDALLVGFVLLATGIDLRDEQIEIRIRTERTFRDQLLAAGGALFVAGPEGCDDAVRTETMQTFLGRHRLLQHVQANGTHQFTVEAARRHGYLAVVGDCLLRSSI